MIGPPIAQGGIDAVRRRAARKVCVCRRRFATVRASVGARHVGLGSGLVDEDESSGIGSAHEDSSEWAQARDAGLRRASILNEKPPDLGIPNRFSPTRSRTRRYGRKAVRRFRYRMLGDSFVVAEVHPIDRQCRWPPLPIFCAACCMPARVKSRMASERFR